MRLLKKLVLKLVMLVIMVGLMGAALRYARPYIMKAAGMPEGLPGVEGVGTPQFSSEESDLMKTVFQSALRLFSGTAKREDLASELSDQLYSGRADSGTMSELGIELVKPGADSSAVPGVPKAGAGEPVAPPRLGIANSQPAAVTPAKTAARPGESPAAVKSPAKGPASNAREVLFGRVWEKAMANPELTLIPVVLVGMFVMHLFRRRRSPEDEFILPNVALQTPADTEPYDMTHAVHKLKPEDFELLVALVYQRQGYRVSMSAGLSGGRGSDFTLARKSERVVVQCKRLNQDHQVPVDRVRELHEATAAAGATRGMYVASCGFTWDARNFAKAKGLTLINARTLDALLTTSREKPDEDLLAVSQWAPKLMSKVKLTPPLCPACEASMDQVGVNDGSVWVCSQRPECRGRRCSRNHYKTVTPAAQKKEKHADGACA